MSNSFPALGSQGTYGTAPGAVPAANVNAYVTNALTPGRNTPANSSPVVLASQVKRPIPANTTAYVFSGGSGGAAGDWLDFIDIIPLTTSPGAVLLADGAFAAAASWTTASTTITMGATLDATKVVAGMTVYDNTSGNTIGTVSSVSGTTLTLTAAAAFASSGAADSLSFYQTIFAGGASSVASLVPFTYAVRADSDTGSWRITTTGANVKAMMVGNPT